MAEMLNEAVQAALAREMAAPLAPGLYLVATPIGNLTDISLRALAVLARADRVFCEDTRHSQKLISHYGLPSRLAAYHDHNAARERPKILKALEGGASVALISDAGTPLISDPGYKLVREAALQGTPVFSIPGASAVLAGLASSGLPTDAFFFAGFLPPREAAARARLEELTGIPGTLILFDTASRLDKTLKSLGELFPARELVIARELTKRFEEVIRVTLPAPALIGADWKGEFVLLISPPAEQSVDEDEIRSAIIDALQHSSLRDAVEDVRRTLRVPRRQVYDLALKHQKGSSRDESE
ncbi:MULTISPECIES: 16S rRNA (cytidine(1402)-2'-O)-methyltransferase [Rhodomicrobium]|uniref:16S rRNA (cytidine(1402)-2'-O)-methyltransferase n=1 Tax=Rhodomicrobium TaxID=1068 RepID=UPI001FD98F0E|nr:MULTISPECIES: 16S rRNA (cytidine(1402)-2'-O)-methyltransferase [Rhodomicrobium]